MEQHIIAGCLVILAWESLLKYRIPIQNRLHRWRIHRAHLRNIRQFEESNYANQK